MLSGNNSDVYWLLTTSGYGVPSLDYYSETASLLGAKVRMKGERTILVLVKGEDRPFVLYLEEVNSKATTNIVVAGAVIGGCLLCVLLLLALALVICRKSRIERVTRVMSLIPREPPTHSREEITELLDASFPIQFYREVGNPICTHCVVCLEQFSSESEVRTLSCGHTYHWRCVEQLFQARMKCGVCNQDFSTLGATGRSTIRLISQLQEDASVIASEGSELRDNTPAF